MRYFVNKLIILLCLTLASSGNAEEIDCEKFGTIEFFKENNLSNIQHCISSIPKDELTKIYPNGNNLPMNAVVANVSALTLSSLLFKYDEDALSNIHQHKNFDELSIIHLAGVAKNGPSLLITLKNYGNDFTVLKDKKEGYISSYDRGVSALHYAISENAPFENILALLAVGVDPHVFDKNGNQAINYAVSKQTNFDTLNLLLSYTKSFYKNDKGFNALHFAVQKMKIVDNLNLVLASIDNDYYDVLTDADETILHLAAASSETPELFNVVLKYSSDFACQEDAKGAKAIDYARQNENIAKSQQVLELLNRCAK